MALNEDALEAMMDRQRSDEKPAESKLTHQTDEFEVYERAKPRPEADPRNVRGGSAPAPENTPAPAPAPTSPPASMPSVPEPEAAPELAPEPMTPPESPPPTLPETPEEPVASEEPAETQPIAAETPTVPAVAETPDVASPPTGPALTESQAPTEPPLVPPSTPAPEPRGAPTLRFPRAEARAPERPSSPPAAPAAAASPPPPATPPQPSPAPSVAAHGDDRPRLALVQADFNLDITDMMADWASRHARTLGATVAHHVHVPGVYDLPLTAKVLAGRDDVDAVVVVGCVIQGETDHDKLITQAAADGLVRVALETGKPVGFGVIGPGMSKAQAEARIGNGKHAVEAAVRQWRTLRGLADPAQADTTEYVAQGH